MLRSILALSLICCLTIPTSAAEVSFRKITLDEMFRSEGVAIADMTSVWEEFLKRKQDWDITGNGVNHPNDFGHRVYAQILSALLIDKGFNSHPRAPGGR